MDDAQENAGETQCPFPSASAMRFLPQKTMLPSSPLLPSKSHRNVSQWENLNRIKRVGLLLTDKRQYLTYWQGKGTKKLFTKLMNE